MEKVRVGVGVGEWELELESWSRRVGVGEWELELERRVGVGELVVFGVLPSQASAGKLGQGPSS